MQTIETPIWAIGSISKGHGDGIILQSGPALGLDNHTFANSPSHPLAPFTVDVDPMTQIKVFIVYTNRLICT